MNGVRKVKKIRKSKKLSALDIIKNVEDGEMDTKRLRKETLEAKKILNEKQVLLKSGKIKISKSGQLLTFLVGIYTTTKNILMRKM
jgi:hypothetical protein